MRLREESSSLTSLTSDFSLQRHRSETLRLSREGPSFTMDSTGHSSTEGELQSNDSMSDHGTLASIDVAALLDETGSQQFHDDSIFPSSLDSQVHRLVEENIAIVKANSEHVQYDGCWVVTDEAETRSLDCHNVVGVDGSPPFRKQGLHIVSVSSETGNLSELSSEGGYESSESLIPCPDIVCSECEPDGVRKSTIEVLDNDLMVSELPNLGCGVLPKTSRLIPWFRAPLMCRMARALKMTRMSLERKEKPLQLFCGRTQLWTSLRYPPLSLGHRKATSPT